MASPNPELHEQLRQLKNFGIADEETMVAPGINGKMSELHAALGLTQLETVDREIENRKQIALLYNKTFAEVPGLMVPMFDTETPRATMLLSFAY